MTDEIVTPSAPVETNVSQPLNAPKPYDDDMLEAYAAEEAVEEGESDSSTEQVKDTPEAKAPPVEEQKEPEAEESSEEKPEPAKAKSDDKIIDGLEEIPIKRLINGKEVEFKIKEAVQAYVKQEEFNRNMDRRITHISQREKRWESEQNQFKDKIGKVIEVTQSGDFVTGIRALAKLAVGNSGADPVEFEKKYFAQLDKIREVYTKLTPEQQEAYFAKRKAAEYEARAKQLEDEKTVNTEKSNLQEKVSSLQQQYGVKDNEFWSNYRALVETQVGEGKHFQAPDEIQAEDVISYSLRVKHEEKVLEAGKKVGISDDAILDEVSRITLVDPTLSVDDIVRVIESSGIAKNASPAAVENLNRKAEKSKTRFTQASSTKKEQNGKIEGYEGEDLDFLYRNQPKAYSRPVR